MAKLGRKMGASSQSLNGLAVITREWVAKDGLSRIRFGEQYKSLDCDGRIIIFREQNYG